MAKWHNAIMCLECWNKYNSNREPVTIEESEREFLTCCYCFFQTNDGIFVRDDAEKLECDHIYE